MYGCFDERKFGDIAFIKLKAAEQMWKNYCKESQLAYKTEAEVYFLFIIEERTLYKGSVLFKITQI